MRSFRKKGYGFQIMEYIWLQGTSVSDLVYDYFRL